MMFPLGTTKSVLSIVGGGSRIVFQKGAAVHISGETAYPVDAFLFSEIHCQPARRTNKINQALGRALKDFVHVGTLPDDDALVDVIQADLTQFQIVKELDDEIIAELTAINTATGIGGTLLPFFPGSIDRIDWKKIKDRINHNLDLMDNDYYATWTIIEEGAMGTAIGFDKAVEEPADRMRCGYYETIPLSGDRVLHPYPVGWDPHDIYTDPSTGITAYANAVWIDGTTYPGEPDAAQWGMVRIDGKEWYLPTKKIAAVYDKSAGPVDPDSVTFTHNVLPEIWTYDPIMGFSPVQISVGLGWGGCETRTGTITFTISRSDGVIAKWQDMETYFGYDLDTFVSLRKGMYTTGSVEYVGDLATVTVSDGGYYYMTIDPNAATAEIEITETNGATVIPAQEIQAYLSYGESNAGPVFQHVYCVCGLNILPGDMP